MSDCLWTSEHALTAPSPLLVLPSQSTRSSSKARQVTFLIRYYITNMGARLDAPGMERRAAGGGGGRGQGEEGRQASDGGSMTTTTISLVPIRWRIDFPLAVPAVFFEARGFLCLVDLWL